MAAAAEHREEAVLVHQAVVAEVDVIAVLHDRGGERAEEEEDEAEEREDLHLVPAGSEVVEDQGRGAEHRRA